MLSLSSSYSKSTHYNLYIPTEFVTWPNDLPSNRELHGTFQYRDNKPSKDDPLAQTGLFIHISQLDHSTWSTTDMLESMVEKLQKEIEFSKKYD